MNISLSCPSKTFFLGEYLALFGGPALLINTTPRFGLHTIFNNKPEYIICRGINPHSPAGKFFNDHRDLLRDYGFEFRDPHIGHGGFGASSSQFLLFYVFVQWLKKSYLIDLKTIDISELLKSYLHYAWDGTGIAPSGADLVAQLNGKITYFHKEKNILETLDWNFPNLEFLVIRTGNKIATHQHLRTFNEIPISRFEESVLLAKDAFSQQDETKLITAIQQFADELARLNFIAEPTKAILTKMQADCPIVAAKGCGALGADVILAFCYKNNLMQLLDWAELNQLAIIGSSQDLSPGIILAQK